MLNTTDLADLAQQVVEPTDILMQGGLSKAANGRPNGKGNRAFVGTLPNGVDTVGQKPAAEIRPGNTRSGMQIPGKPRVEGTQMSLSVAIGEVGALVRSSGVSRCLYNRSHQTRSSHNWAKALGGSLSSMSVISCWKEGKGGSVAGSSISLAACCSALLWNAWSWWTAS